MTSRSLENAGHLQQEPVLDQVILHLTYNKNFWNRSAEPQRCMVKENLFKKSKAMPMK